MAFSSHVFALQAEAPLGATSFREVPAGIIILPHEQKHDDRPEKIRKYFERYHLPLAQHAEAFVASADKYELDWRLLAAIGFIESTGGKFACTKVGHNAFGWASCKIGFSSYEEAIDTITKNLAGKYYKTAHHYAGKDIRGILWAYNPDTIRAGYGSMVMKQMEIIDSM